MRRGLGRTEDRLSRRSFTTPTRMYVAATLVAGLVAAAQMLSTVGQATGADLQAFIVLGGVGLTWSLLTFFVNRSDAGRPAVALAPAAAVALFPIAGPAAVGASALMLMLTDWWVHRRNPLPALFNIGQTLVSAWLASWAARRVLGAIDGLHGVAVAALVGALCFSLANVALTLTLFVLRQGRKALASGILGYAALTNEAIIGCFAALMAVCWSVHPLALAIPVVPLTLVFLLLARLERREDDLRTRQAELQAIQELGLQVSAQLDAEQLRPAISRIVAEDLRARGTALLLLDDERRQFEVVGSFDRAEGAAASASPRLLRAGLTDEILATGTPRILTAEQMSDFPELTALSARSAIVQPLSILGRPDGALVVFDDGQRAPFTDQDAEHLAGLVRFIEVALNNARLYDDLRRVQQHLIQSEKMSALGQLVSGVAHELNNPLATISGSAELAAAQDLPDGARSMIVRILKESERAARIVRNLLTFSRRHKPEVGWHDLAEIVDDVIEMRSYECRVRNIALRKELMNDVPPVRIDRHQIHQVLLNLVTNAEQAIELSGQSGGSIVIRTHKEAQRVRLDVCDDGPGIGEENIGRIFNPFFTTKPVGKGTGLGLSICYGIVQEHGGTIRVRSAPGRGAVFTVELPAPSHDAPPRTPAAGTEADRCSVAVTTSSTRPLSVLVVDDEDGVRTVIAEALVVWGHSVTTANSGEAGVERLRAQRFDLAIIDFRMPGLDGEGLYRTAQQEQIPLPPVVFATGDAGSPQTRKFFEETGATVLLKPFTLMTLRETVGTVIAGQPRDANLSLASAANFPEG